MPNILQTKGNQTVKLGRLIECNMRNTFLEKPYAKCDTETSPRPFSENQNWAYLCINSLRFYTVCFHCMPSYGLLKHIESKLQTTCFLPHFRHIFQEKYSSCYTPLIDQVSLSGWLYFVSIGQYVYCNC